MTEPASLPALADLLRKTRAEGDPSKLGALIPYLATLGIGFSIDAGRLTARMAFADSLIGNANLPALHGGAIGGLLESAAIFQVLWEGETLVLPKIVTITVDYLRSGRPVDTYARGTVTKPGKRVVNVSVEAWQDDPARPIARANAIFLVQPVDD